MLINEILTLQEMAKPAKKCEKCGHQMSKFHYWYKGGWKCKSTNSKTTAPSEKEAKDIPTRKPKDDAPAKKQWAYVYRDELKAGKKVKGLNDK